MKKHKLKIFLSLFLTITILCQSTVSGLAETSTLNSLQTLYISDVAIGTKSELVAAGYQVDDSSFTGRYMKKGETFKNGSNSNVYGNGVCIGYKTTHNPKEAITDISVMDMYGGYNQLSYMDLLKEQKKDMVSYAKNIQTVANEFKENYHAGNQYAKLAYTMLNYLMVPAEDGREDMLMGDYLTSTDLDLSEDDFVNMVFISSSVVTSYIYSQLCFGVSDDLSSSLSRSWLTRLCENGPFVLEDEKTGEPITDAGIINDYYDQNLDGLYRQRAAKLFDAVKKFADEYKLASMRNGGDKLEIELTAEEAKAVEKEECDSLKLDLTDVESQTTSTLEKDKTQCSDAIILSLYQKLDERDEDGEPIYYYGEDEEGNTRSLAEFFIEVGSADFNAGDDPTQTYRLLYPMIMEQYGQLPMTSGQEIMFYVSGFTASVSVALGDISLSETTKNCTDSAKEMLNLNGGKAVSIWFNVDKSMYDGDADGVYWTSSLARITAAKNRYDLLTEPTDAKEYTTKEKLKDAMLLTGTAAITMSTVSSILGLLVGAFSTVSASGETIAAVAAAYWAGTAVSYTTTTCVACVVAQAMTVMVAVSVVIIVVMALIYLIDDIIHQKSSDLDYTEIPNIIYDYKDEVDFSGCAVKYSPILSVGIASPSTSGIFSYFSTNRCFPWVCLFYTKDPNAGKPITLEMDGTTVVTPPFVSYYSGKVIDASMGVNIKNVGIMGMKEDGLYYERQLARGSTLMTIPLKNYCDTEPGEGYMPIHGFSENFMYNLAYYGSDGFSGSLEDRLKNLNFASKLGWYMHREESQQKTKDGKYICDVMMASDTSHEVAKNKIISAGYELINEDLTSDANVHTYIGYITTDNQNDALTDLRVAYSSGIDPKSGTISHGAATYGCCGNVGNLCLMETSSPYAGTPILTEGLTVSHSFTDYRGVEPVNLFCGGPAFNFNSGNGWKVGQKEGASKWETKTYIYFLPSETFTANAQDAEEYVGGIAFFSGNNIEQYIADTGWTILSETDISGHQYTGLHVWDDEKDSSFKTLICYSTTYNPYRAVYGLTQYTCELMSTGLIYNISVGGCGYTACDVFQQGGVGDLSTKERALRYSHAYRSSNYYEGSYSSDEGSTKKDRYGMQECIGFQEEDETQKAIFRDVIAAGMYVTGNTTYDIKTAKPIQADELYATNSSEFNPKQQTPVRSMTDWYSEKGVNLGYQEELDQEWLDKLSWCNHLCNEKLYLYIDRQDTVKGNFVDTIKVAYSGDGRIGANGKKSEMESPYDMAIVELLSAGPGQLIPINLSADDDTYRVKYERTANSEDAVLLKNAITCRSQEECKAATYSCHLSRSFSTDLRYVNCDYSDEVAYIWVTYTNAVTNNLSDIRLYESDSNTAPKEMTLSDGSKANLCGDGFRVDNGSKYYYLYGVRGLGTRITEISLGSEVFHLDDWTTVTVDNCASDYSKYYIYAEHYKNKKYQYYVTSICTASGKTEREAQIALLNQGCRYACPFNLSPGLDQPIYMGYGLTSNYQKAYSGLILANNGQDDTISDIIVGKDAYERIEDNLNTGVYDAIISLYATKSQRKAHEADPDGTTIGHYISGVMFWYDKNLKDCFDGNDDEVKSKLKTYLSNLNTEDRKYLTHYLYDDGGNVIKMDIVTDYNNKIINCNLGAENFVSKNAKTADVFMFVHYSDNYVRDPAKLTGSLFSSKNIIWLFLSATALLGCAVLVILIQKKRKINNKGEKI